MLMKCPECELQVSDKALSCPHCGYPLKKEALRRPTQKRRKKLPNGFGQITELKNQNLRKPFRAMVTIGFDDRGKPIAKLLKPEAYFASYNEAYSALVEYNRNPYDLEPAITVANLFEKWSDEYFKTLKSDSSKRNILSAWSYCASLYRMRVTDLRARHIKGCIEEGCKEVNGEQIQASANIKSRMKSLFNSMLDYAVEYEIVDRNYARTFTLSDSVIDESDTPKRGHISFTDTEFENIKGALGSVQYVDLILIQCYTGLRPQELGLIETSNLNINNWTMTGGMKTEAGTNRLIPIHSFIQPLVQNYYSIAIGNKSKYLFTCTDGVTHKQNTMLTYDKYKQRFDKVMSVLNMNKDHRPHDCRKQFITMAKKSGVDEYAIKYIVGHAITDITEKVYTDRHISWLSSEIEKIR